MKKLIALAAALAIAGCTTTTTSTPAVTTTVSTPAPAGSPAGTPPTVVTTVTPGTTTTTTENLVDQINQIAIPDLQAAAADAMAQVPPDKIAALCWTGLIPIATQIQAMVDAAFPPSSVTVTTPPPGTAPATPQQQYAFLTFQQGRDALQSAAKAAGTLASFLAGQNGMLASIRQDFEMACGPLIADITQDVQNPLGKLIGGLPGGLPGGLTLGQRLQFRMQHSPPTPTRAPVLRRQQAPVAPPAAAPIPPKTSLEKQRDAIERDMKMWIAMYAWADAKGIGPRTMASR